MTSGKNSTSSSSKSFRKIEVEHLGGEVFTATHDWSNREALWSELFKEKERTAMRKHLVQRTICFSIRDTYQMSVRMLLTKQALEPNDPTGLSDNALKGQVALLLHDYTGKLTSSWAWAKIVYPLYKANISVVMVDWPGYGSSKAAGEKDVPLESWVDKDWKIVVQLLDTLSIRKCHIVTCGQACNSLFRMFAMGRLRLEGTHVCLNPAIDLNRVCPLPLRPGLQPEELEEMKVNQVHEFNMLLHNCRSKTWCVFDQAEAHQTESSLRLLSDFAELPYASDQVTITQITDQHITTAAAGSTVPVQVLFPCRWLKSGMVRHILNDADFRPPKSLTPEDNWEQTQRAYAGSGAGSTSTTSFPPVQGGGGRKDSQNATTASWAEFARGSGLNPPRSAGGLHAAASAWGEPCSSAGLPPPGSAAGGVGIGALDTWSSGFGRNVSTPSLSRLDSKSTNRMNLRRSGTHATSWNPSASTSSWNPSSSGGFRPTTTQSSWNPSSSGGFRPTTQSSWMSGRSNTHESILTQTAKFFGPSPCERFDNGDTLIPRPAHINQAMTMACQLQIRSASVEREALLSNTKAVTRLRNVTEQRGGTAADMLGDAPPEERRWIEDALDVSMVTYESDDYRRRHQLPAGSDKYKAARQRTQKDSRRAVRGKMQ